MALSRLELRKQATRRDILEAASACFAENGYHATGVGDIAKRVGIAHGTFYLYFQSKREILEQVLSDLLARITAALEGAPPDEPASLADYQAQADHIADALTGVFADDPRSARLLLFQAPAVDSDMAERVLGFFDALAVVHGAYLRHGVEAGYFRQDLDVDSAARALNGMILAAVMHGLRDPGPEAMAQLSRTVREIIYHGIAHPRR